MNMNDLIHDLGLANGQTKRMTCPHVILRIHLLLLIIWVRSYGTVTRLGAVCRWHTYSTDC